MTEKIRTDSEEFKRAVARGDRRQIREWDERGLILWNEKNHIARELSARAQAERKRREEAEDAGQAVPREPTRVDRIVGKGERLSHSHPAVQGAIRRGDSQLLAELIGDERYERVQGSGEFGSFTWSDLDSHYRKDAS